MELEDTGRSAKRFKHQSYAQSLKDVHLPPALSLSQFDNDIEDNDSHFHQAIDRWRQLNLSPAFVNFANKADGLSASMPLLLHHWKEIVELWLSALDAADDEALKALLDLLQKLTHDIRIILSPSYEDLVSRLVVFLPKPISAEALTALLASFSSLFKHVLNPTEEPNLVQRTWCHFRDILPKCNPEVRRATAEVWGTSLRKFKLPAREVLVTLLLNDVDLIEDMCAWIFVVSCKSVAQSLHSATTSILALLVDHYASVESGEQTFTLIRRVLTALIHHVKSADQFAPIADLVIDRFKRVSTDEGQLAKILPVIVVICSVRQGSRLSKSQLSELASLYTSLTYSPILHIHLLKLSTSLLIAGDTSSSLGPGRKLLEHGWSQDLKLAMELCGCLAELDWNGWKMIAVSQILKQTFLSLEKNPRKTFRLLASLHQDKQLSDVDAVWKERMEKWVVKRLMEFDVESNEENVCELHDILKLSSLFPAVLQMFTRILEITLDKEDPRRDFQETPANSSFVLGLCFEAAAMQQKSTWSDRLQSPSIIMDVSAKWGWSENVMSGVERFVSIRPEGIAPMFLDTIYPYLRDHIMSHSRELRLSVLKLLASSIVTCTPNEKHVIERCLQFETIPVDVNGVRERVFRIGRICQIVPDGSIVAADIAARWLLAQLKVNLRPLWSAATHALATLSERFGDIVWDLIFKDIRHLCQIDELSNRLPPWASIVSDDDNDEVQEEEITWRDPSAHKMRVAVIKWTSDNVSRRDLIKIQIPRDRFDSNSYETQLLATLGECSSLAEKHNKDLVQLFLSIVDPDTPSKYAHRKLTLWLTLFSKFTNPKALYSTGQLQTLYVSLLSHPDRSLQKLALSCILTYKSPHLTPYTDTLDALLDDTRRREELTGLVISQIEEGDRKEYVDVLVRLLYGIMLEKRGKSRGSDRRETVISALGGCSEEELAVLIDLMLGPIRRHGASRPEGNFAVRSLSAELSQKQQIGYLNLLGDVLKILGPRILPYWQTLLETVFDLLAHAQSSIESRKHEGDVVENEEEGEEDMEDATSPLEMVRSVRQLGLKRLADFFKSPLSFDFSPYMTEAFRTIISPRVSILDQENTQAPSALLELIYAWTLRAEYAGFLTDYDGRVLPKVYDCLTATNVKPAVISRIFDIVDGLLALSATSEDISMKVLRPHVSCFLANLSTLAGRTKELGSASNALGQRQIFMLSELAQYLTDSSQASTFLGLFSPLLRKPSKVVPEKVKADMIKIVSSLVPLVPELGDPESTIHTKTYALLAQLLQSLRARPARTALISAFQRFSTLDHSLLPVAELVDSLNAYSSRRIEEPDFDRRMGAFAKLNEEFRTTFSPKQWLPILYNMLYFIQDPTELAIRTNSAHILRCFIDITASAEDKQWETTFLKVLYPGLKNGLRSKNEMVRGEVLSVIAHAVAQCRDLAALQEMRILLADGDEEANFFNNIHHVQLHRRTRALRRLADYCQEGHLRSSTLAEVFVPLVGNFISTTDVIDHHLVNEAIITTGRMACHLGWGAYNTLIHQYLRQMEQKDASERVYVRAVVAILDNFHFPMDETVLDADAVGDEDLEMEEPVKDKGMARIADAVTTRLLPALLKHLEKRDENEDTLRIPISVGIINVAKHLPEQARQAHVSRLLTVLSQVFRSKSQETRDLARETLCRIAINLGPTYLPHIIRELRAALLRGPHLHVLAVVTHALLVHVTTPDHMESFDVLDSCVEDASHISAEVIFGQSGKDTQSEGFKTKMREVRSSSSKGLDSFGIIAKHITPIKISSLLHPIRSIFYETETLKTLQQAEDVLRRIAGGLNSNKHLAPSELLSLCHSLISQNARFLQDAPRVKRSKRNTESAIVQLKRTAPTTSDHYANNSFRFVVFGLDLFHTAHRRNRFDFQDPGVISRLEPMVIVIGNTLYSQNADVLSLGIKAVAAILKCPLKSVIQTLPVVIAQIIEIVRETGSTESEVVQIALKSLATILRDHDSAQAKEKDLVFLLEIISPDLEEPSRQASGFAILRAIIARKFVVPEIYDLMDRVSEIMVTNQSSQVQELCRGALLQFLLDYPQGKKRLQNQMSFLAKNLSYVYESGRKSVMELLSALVSKFEAGLIQEYGDLFFVALVMVIANDESAKCIEMAAELIKSLYLRLDDGHRKVILSHLHSWASQISQSSLAGVACQVYGFVADAEGSQAQSIVGAVIQDVVLILQRSAPIVEMDGDEVGEEMVTELDWRSPYYALVVLSKVLGTFPDITTTGGIDWAAVVTHLLYPHAWVRTASTRLLGTLFTSVPPEPPKIYETAHPPSLFSLTWMEDVAKKMCLQLKSEHLDETLSLQIVKNLFYVGKCFSALPLSFDERPEDNREVDNESEGDHDEEEETTDSKRQPLRWLFSNLSFQARAAHISRRNRATASHNWSQRPLAVLRWFAAMSNHLEPTVLELFLFHILSPVYRIVEDDTIRDPRMDDLKTTAVELQDLIQGKVGAIKFSAVYNDIRQGVISVRRERKIARTIQVTTHPEAAAQRKIQRNTLKKQSRKRKDTLFAESRGRLKRRRNE